MAEQRRSDHANTPLPILIVSGGAGTTGEQLVYTALAQFPEGGASVEVLRHVQRRAQVARAVDRARREGGIIVHTLVDEYLRSALVTKARSHRVPSVDLMGGMLSALTRRLRQPPAGRPGLYRQREEEHFKRVEAIEFAVAHDDGSKTEELSDADIVLVGPSRVGKTPISMYLSMLGWKVANVPFVSGIPLPDTLSDVDPRKVVALTIQPAHLRTHRRERASRIGAGDSGDYTDMNHLKAELAESRRLCDSMGFAPLDVTDKPIEEIANAIAQLVASRTA